MNPDLIGALAKARKEGEKPKEPALSPLRAAMARLDARLNGKDRRTLRRAQNKVNGTKESFAAMSARLMRDLKKGDTK